MDRETEDRGVTTGKSRGQKAGVSRQELNFKFQSSILWLILPNSRHRRVGGAEASLPRWSVGLFGVRIC
jgi:hypothetical protein